MGKWKDFADDLAGALGELTLELAAVQEEARYQKARAEQATCELRIADGEIALLKAELAVPRTWVEVKSRDTNPRPNTLVTWSIR